MKAWKCTSDHCVEGYTLIRFADTASKARADASHTEEFHDLDYVDIRAVRAPEFDGREENPPELRELVEEHGWWTRCSTCECRIDSDGAHPHGASEVPAVWDGEYPYCANCAPTHAGGWA